MVQKAPARTIERGEREAKRMLVEAAKAREDGGVTEWNKGYEAALISLLLSAYGIGSDPVPATYKFDDAP